MRSVAMMAVVVVVAACGGGGGSGGAAKPERAPLDPAAKPVQIELAWVVTSAPTEVKETECTLVLRVIRPGVPKDEMHQMGAWWREQKVLIALVEMKSADGPLFYRTEAVFGSDGDLTKGPEFEVVREKDGAVIVRGRDEDTPWRQIERVEVPATTPVEARAPEAAQ
jgi:hypothetical protein